MIIRNPCQWIVQCTDKMCRLHMDSISMLVNLTLAINGTVLQQIEPRLEPRPFSYLFSLATQHGSNLTMINQVMKEIRCMRIKNDFDRVLQGFFFMSLTFILFLQLQKEKSGEAIIYTVLAVLITIGCFLLAIWYSHRIYKTISRMHSFAKEVRINMKAKRRIKRLRTQGRNRLLPETGRCSEFFYVFFSKGTGAKKVANVQRKEGPWIRSPALAPTLNICSSLSLHKKKPPAISLLFKFVHYKQIVIFTSWQKSAQQIRLNVHETIIFAHDHC